MGKRNTFTGIVRVTGASQSKSQRADGPSRAVLKAVLAVPVADASVAAGTGTGKYLPKGAIVTDVSVKSGVTGGTAPTINVGLGLAIPDPDALLANQPADADDKASVGDAQAGVLLGATLTEDAEITVGTGTGTSGTGGVNLYVEYTFEDDGKVQD